MKLYIPKLIIIITLALILAIMPGINGYKQAEASFVPFVVENIEWILALLAGMGITFTSQSDAIAGAHKYAYGLESSDYSILQQYIQDIKNKQEAIKGIALYGLYELGIMDRLYGVAMGLAQEIIDLLVVPVEYVMPDDIEYDTGTDSTGNYIEFDYIKNYTFQYQVSTVSGIHSLTKAVHRVTGDIQGYSSLRQSGTRFYTQAGYSGTAYTLAEGDIVTVKLIDNGTNWKAVYWNVTQNYGNINSTNWSYPYASIANYRVRIYPDLLSGLNLNIDRNISADIKKDNVEVDERIRDLPLPSESISVWQDKIITVPDTVPDVIGKKAHDLILQPSKDVFGNPVLDDVGNPVYEPVPETWPGTETLNPPWELAPDLEGVTEGIGGIGGLLEKIGGFIGNIGTLILGIPASIAALFRLPEGTEFELDFTPFTGIILHEKFPFSLPWDLQRVISRFQAEPEAPKWEVPILEEVIEIDFSIFSSWANIVRVFLSIIYIVVLVIITKRFLG